MNTLKEAWSICEDLNKEAYQMASDIWNKADELSNSNEKGAYEESEKLREQASAEQCGYFKFLFDGLEEETYRSIIDWAKKDKDFRKQFEGWTGTLLDT